MKTDWNKITEGMYSSAGGIAVLTSGGDSSGMNAALRGIIRISLYVGVRIFIVRDGYRGLIDNKIEEARWETASSIIEKGGTIIGSARCKEFMTVEGRAKSAKNLIQHGISNLIVIGGDGSLTGAADFRKEWPMLLEMLTSEGQISREQVEANYDLSVIGMVGTIDNDFPCTDMTIGTDTALHRIQEAVDSIRSTAFSHSRTFILEIMGRHCGYLSLKTALTSEADYLFVPESPPPLNWKEELQQKLDKSAQNDKKRLHLIIVAEGAIDQNNEPITSLDVQNILKKRYDSRITVLGHVQRGGNTSAFDRILGTISGAEAVLALMEQKQHEPPVVICLLANNFVRMQLYSCIETLSFIKTHIRNKEYAKAMGLRGTNFIENLKSYKVLNGIEASENDPVNYKFAVVNIGTPACGMNASFHSFTRQCLNLGAKVYGVHGSIDGLIRGSLIETSWSDVTGLVAYGGTVIGAKRLVPTEEMYPKIDNTFRKFEINGLLIIGGFDSYVTALEFVKRRDKYSSFKMPIAVIPATINNNVPGSDFSIGCDTALNIVTHVCDVLRQSAAGTENRVFVLETMGGYCGYLCSMAGVTTGADATYIHEDQSNICDIIIDVQNMISKMKSGKQLRGLVLCNENSNRNYNTDFINHLYSEHGKHVFSSRKNILGHVQQGHIPTTFDRSLAIKLSMKAVSWFFEQIEKGANDAVVIGIKGNTVAVTPVEQLVSECNFTKRVLKNPWWLKYRKLSQIIALHDSVYKTNK